MRPLRGVHQPFFITFGGQVEIYYKYHFFHCSIAERYGDQWHLSLCVLMYMCVRTLKEKRLELSTPNLVHCTHNYTIWQNLGIHWPWGLQVKDQWLWCVLAACMSVWLFRFLAICQHCL